MLAIIQGLYILREDEDEEIERHRRKEAAQRATRELQKRKTRDITKKKRSRNREYTIVSCFFVLIFVSMIGYLIYFDQVKSEDFINSPYNTRQDSFSDRVVRGKIVSCGRTGACTDQCV